MNDSFESVVERYKDMVYRISFTYCKNASDADDVTQDVFLAYYKNAPVFLSDEHLKAWLIRVTVNASKKVLRSSWFKKTVPLSDYENLITDQPEALETFHSVMALPPKYRAVILLYYFEGYSVKETAEILQLKESAVQTQLGRARAKLKQQLQED